MADGTGKADKSVIVSIDGTGRKSRHNTAVFRIWKAAERAGHKTLYCKGVGSGPFRWNWRAITGKGIGGQIRHAYRFLGEHLGPDDGLYVFGYSRGAAAAVSLTNLLLRCGVSEAVRERKVARKAWRAYGARAGYAGMEQAEFAEKHRTFRPSIRMLGLFDPVGALGVPFPRQLARIAFGQHDMTLRPGVGDVPPVVELRVSRVASPRPAWRACSSKKGERHPWAIMAVGKGIAKR